MKLKLHLKQWLMIGLLLAGLGLVAAPVLADGLPDRNPPPPAVVDDGGSDDNAPLGAAIELTAWPPGGMSVVQWQDINGDWQDVEGWRGALDSSGRIRWWVAAKDFGSNLSGAKKGRGQSERALF
jgi:hypothetical protein